MNADGSAPWIKIITRIFEDPKMIAMEQLPDGFGVQILWFKLLTLAGEQNRGGSVYFTDSVPFTAELLAAKWRCKPSLVQFAIGVFQKYGMVGIDQEGTIFISNWPRYQNGEGLARIRDRSLLQLGNGDGHLTDMSAQRRAAAAERQRKHRQRNREAEGGQTRAVTRDSVTVTQQNKKEIENKDLPPCPPRGTEMGVIDVQETRRRLSNLFGRTRGWSDNENEILAQLFPIADADLRLLEWGYSLNRDSEGWACYCGQRVTKPKQSLSALLREFPSELDKWRIARAHTVDAAATAQPQHVEWPPGGREAAIALYGPRDEWPEFFDQLTSSVQSEIRAQISRSQSKKVASGDEKGG
jgi:predicted phage replisome organizer